ncbi:hypothetical protein L7F22_021698 [Adiantum nelumboides]|nr:hypothetical protein [Adiantum nelumboides]
MPSCSSSSSSSSSGSGSCSSGDSRHSHPPAHHSMCKRKKHHQRHRSPPPSPHRRHSPPPRARCPPPHLHHHGALRVQAPKPPKKLHKYHHKLLKRWMKYMLHNALAEDDHAPVCCLHYLGDFDADGHVRRPHSPPPPPHSRPPPHKRGVGGPHSHRRHLPHHEGGRPGGKRPFCRRWENEGADEVEAEVATAGGGGAEPPDLELAAAELELAEVGAAAPDLAAGEGSP